MLREKRTCEDVIKEIEDLYRGHPHQDKIVMKFLIDVLIDKNKTKEELKAAFNYLFEKFISISEDLENFKKALKIGFGYFIDHL